MSKSPDRLKCVHRRRRAHGVLARLSFLCLISLVAGGLLELAATPRQPSEADPPNPASATEPAVDADETADRAPQEAPAETRAPTAAERETERIATVLAREQARADQAHQTIEAHLADLLSDSEHFDEALEQTRATASSLHTRLRILTGDGSQADALYEEIVAELQAQRRGLNDALAALRSPADPPTFEARLDLDGLGVPGQAAAIDDLRSRYESIERDRDQAYNLTADLARRRVRGRGEVISELNRVRIDALERLGRDRRGELLGVSEDGRAQIVREGEHLALMTRYWIETRLEAIRAGRGQLGNVSALGAAGFTLAKALGIFVFWLFVRARSDDWLKKTGRILARMVDGTRNRRRLETLFRGFRTLAPWGVFLLALEALRRYVLPEVGWPEIDLLLRLLMLYGGYRLTIDTLNGLALTVARTYRLRLTDQRTARVLVTVRLLTRFGFGIAFLLMVASQLLGRGALYHLVLRVAWVLLALLLLWITAKWRTTIGKTYLDQGRSGPMTQLVRHTQERWYGVFVAAAALLLLAVRGVAVMARDFALGFDHTRRALAFVFRRKMEKQAAIQGYADVDPRTLPQTMLDAFTEKHVEGELTVDHFPGLERLADSVEQWYGDGTGGSFLLHGAHGAGKTSWLARARKIGDKSDYTPWTLVALDDRLRSPKRLASTLAEALEFPEVEGDLKALQNKLLDGPPRRIVIDRAQNLFLGAVDGFYTMEAFVNLMEATCRRVYWLCAINGNAWHMLNSVRPDLNVFRRQQELERWSEERIRELIRVRSEACGLEVTYEDLFVDRLDRLDARIRSEETDRGYTRLLWDYAGGNPRLALHFWLRSLVPEGPNRARVRLFRSPEADEIEALGEQSLFLLAALANHDNLTLFEASQVTRYPLPLCRIRFERMRDLGALAEKEHRFRITTHWQRVVERTLRRQNLLDYDG